jgi:uncharacterized protein (TIGR02588 family)
MSRPGSATSAPRTLGLAAALATVLLLGRRLLTVAHPERRVASEQGGGPDSSQSSHAEPRPVRERGRSAAEWTSLAISSAILAALVGTLTYLHFSGGEEPAAVEVMPRLDQVRTAGQRFYLPVEVSNRGGLTAQDVRVQVVLGAGADRQETAELLIDFLAGGGSAKGTAVFERDPRGLPLEIVVLSYLEP